MRAAVMLLSLATGCASVPSEDPAQDAPEENPITGSLSARYRGRWGDDVDDHDMYAVLALEAGDIDQEGWEGSLLGRVAQDLDGTDPSFGSLSDAGGDSTDVDLYHGWVDLDVGEGYEPLRLGRQLLLETPELAWFDGASGSTEPLGESAWTFGAYGGIPVHLFESSSSGDLAAGAWVETRPWEGGRARLDVMRLEDEITLGPLDNDLIGLDLAQTAADDLHLTGHASWIEGDPRDGAATAAWFPEGWTVRLRYYELFETQSQRALEADPFFDTLVDLFPFRQTQALIVRDLESAVIEVGGEVREVDDEGDVGEFNRDFERGWTSLTLPDALAEDLALTLSLDRWFSDDADNEGLGFDLAKRMGESEASLGSAYALYKLDLFFDQERVDVRTWYLRWRRRPAEGLGIDVRYEYERSEGEDIHGARVVLTWRF